MTLDKFRRDKIQNGLMVTILSCFWNLLFISEMITTALSTINKGDGPDVVDKHNHLSHKYFFTAHL